MIYKAVKYILENDSTLATALGTDSDSDVKVYPINPRKEVSPPFCVFNVMNMTGNPTKENPSNSGLDNYLVRVAVYDTELDDVITLSEYVRDAMDGEKLGGTYNSVSVVSIDFYNLRDGFVADGNRGYVYIEMDFEIWAIP